MVTHIQKYHDMHIQPNITKAEWDRLKNFKAQQELIKLPADKGSAIVIEKDQKYIRKEQDQINDMDVVPCTRSENAILRHVRSRIIEEFKSMGLKEKEYRYYLVTAAEVAKMYLPIKTHKPHDDFPGRPVVNQTCDPTYNLCKELQKIIHPLAIRAKSYIKDSFHFKQMLKEVEIQEHFIQLSFDIRSLFPSIPIKPTLAMIHNKLQNDKSLKERTKWQPKNIVNLIQICTEETHFKDFEGNIWTQTDGTAMGKSISGDITGIFMESYEEEFVFNPNNNKFIPAFWKREVDDVYCLWQYGQDNIQNFLDYLNSRHSRIKWTIEVEKEGILPFVDLSLCRRAYRISAGIYRKASHTLKYSTFSSNRPRAEQLGIVKSMLNRAYNLCDEGEPLVREVKLLNDAFIANGYHPKDVDRIISTYEHQKRDKNEEAKNRCDTICIPYVQGVSDILRKQLAKEGVNLIFKKGRTLRQFLFNGEPKKSTRKKNVCYRVPCLNCSYCYIGETSQWWDEREKQHKRCISNQDENNSFWQHLKQNPDHVIGWDQVSFLAFDSRFHHRRMKESILIDIFANPGVMNIEDGMKKDACWTVLFPSLRKRYSEK